MQLQGGTGVVDRRVHSTCGWVSLPLLPHPAAPPIASSPHLLAHVAPTQPPKELVQAHRRPHKPQHHDIHILMEARTTFPQRKRLHGA